MRTVLKRNTQVKKWLSWRNKIVIEHLRQITLTYFQVSLTKSEIKKIKKEKKVEKRLVIGVIDKIVGA